jgi:hypothetical protein
VYNLHQHIKNDTDSTDVVENDYKYLIEKGCDVNKLGQIPLWLALNILDRKKKTELVGHSIAELRSRPEIICEELVP